MIITYYIIWIVKFHSYISIWQMGGITREHLVEIVGQFEPCPENLQRMVLGIDGMDNSASHGLLDMLDKNLSDL